MPVDRLLTAVRPLVPRDNPATVLDLLPEFLVTEEVLVGLGLIDGGATRFAFADGRTETIAPVTASSFASVGSILAAPRRPAGTQPVWLRFTERTQWLTRLDRGRAVYLGYHLTTDETYTVSRRLLALASRPGVRAVVVDVRLNHGGNNMTYGALLDVIGRLSRTRSVSLLIGRATFSAAGNFAADVDALPRVRSDRRGDRRRAEPVGRRDDRRPALDRPDRAGGDVVPALRPAERAHHAPRPGGAAHRRGLPGRARPGARAGPRRRLTAGRRSAYARAVESVRALLVRVGADGTDVGGRWNAPVDRVSGAFAYVPITEPEPVLRRHAAPSRALGARRRSGSAARFPTASAASRRTPTPTSGISPTATAASGGARSARSSGRATRSSSTPACATPARVASSTR